MALAIYAGTRRGVGTLRMDTGSCHFEAQGLENWPVQKLEVDLSSPTRVLAATRGDGVWLSEDAGKSWQKPNFNKPGPGKVHCVTIDPHNPRRLYAGGEPIELFVSDDGGANWERMASVRALPFIESIRHPNPTIEGHIRDVVVDPKDSDTLYLALQVGYMLKTVDGGRSWRLLDKDVDADVHTIAVDEDDPTKILIATGGNHYRSGLTKGRALYRSEDAGESWLPTAMEFPHDYAAPMAVDTRDSNLVYAALAAGAPRAWGRRESGAESVLVRTSDRGMTWNQMDPGSPEAAADFPRAIAADPSQAGRVYVAYSKIMLASDDAGDSWRRMEYEGPPITDMQCAVV